MQKPSVLSLERNSSLQLNRMRLLVEMSIIMTLKARLTTILLIPIQLFTVLMRIPIIGFGRMQHFSFP